MTRIGMAWRLPTVGLALALTMVGCGDDDGDDTTTPDMATTTDSGPMGEDAGPMDEDGGPMDEDAGPMDEDGGPMDEDGGPMGGALDTFEVDVATAKCAALFRCCDAASIEDFFGQYECFPGLTCPFEDEQALLPPADMAACVTVMQALDEVTFGGWLSETRAGRADFDEAAHQACLDELATAACGADLEAALYDGQCFARTASVEPYQPLGTQHVMFDRTAGVGDSCVTFYEERYGSCDPEVAFCCVGSPCSVGGLGGDSGTCVAISGDGEPCSENPDAQLCSPDLRCPPAPGLGEPTFCETVAPPADLALGDTCLDDGFQPTGRCVGSYCDQASRTCTATLANGESCFADEECTSGSCAVVGGGPFVMRECADPTFCVGS